MNKPEETELIQEQIDELNHWYSLKPESFPLPQDFIDYLEELDCLDLYNAQQLAEFEADL